VSLIQTHANTVGLHRSYFLQKSRYKKQRCDNKTYLWRKGEKKITKNSAPWSWEKKASHKKKKKAQATTLLLKSNFERACHDSLEKER